jgi:hypothetical protein
VDEDLAGENVRDHNCIIFHFRLQIFLGHRRNSCRKSSPYRKGTCR